MGYLRQRTFTLATLEGPEKYEVELKAQAGSQNRSGELIENLRNRSCGLEEKRQNFILTIARRARLPIRHRATISHTALVICRAWCSR
jgi:hypothetical protein